MSRLSTTISCVLLLVRLSSANADLVYDSGVEPSEINTNRFADVDSGSVGDDFSLAMDASVNEVMWTGLYFSGGTPETDAFTLRFHDFSGSSPAVTPTYTFAVGDAVNRTDTGVDETLSGNPYDIYAYTAAIPSTPLAAGRYLLSIQNDTTADTDDTWAWLGDRGDGDGYYVLGGGSWTVEQPTVVLDFALAGQPAAVPEPSSLALLGLLGSVSGAAGWWKRRRKQTA